MSVDSFLNSYLKRYSIFYDCQFYKKFCFVFVIERTIINYLFTVQKRDYRGVNKEWKNMYKDELLKTKSQKKLLIFNFIS